MRMTFNISKWMIFVIIILLLNLFIYPASSQTAGEWVDKGNALIKSEEYEKAVDALNKAIAINPKEKSAWFYKGNALSSLNEYDKAIEAYDRALAIDPNYKEAWLGKGATFAKVGNSKKVFEAIDMAIAIDPNYEDAWISKGLAHWDFKEYEKAVEAFDRELTINPNVGGVWGFKGEVLNDWGEYEKAIEAFDKAITLDQNDKYSWYGKGFALYKLGRYKDSIEAFDRAIAIDPSLKDENGFRDLAVKKIVEQTTSTQSDGQENKWIIISGIAIFIIIGIIALRNRKNKSNNEGLKNTNTDYKINKWKIFGYVVITWFVFSFLAEILTELSNIEISFAQGVVWSWMSVFLGIIMAYRLVKIIELVYGIVVSFVALFPIIGTFIGIGYFGWSYIKLEKQKFGKEQKMQKAGLNTSTSTPFEDPIEHINNDAATKPDRTIQTENMNIIEALLFTLGLLISLIFLLIGGLSIVFFSFFEIAFNWQDFLFYLLIALIASGIVMAVGSSIDKKFNNSVKAFLEGTKKALFDDKGLLRTFSLLLIILLPLLLYLLAFALYSAITFALYGFLLISIFPRVPVIVLIGLAIVAIGTGIAVLLGLYYLVFPPRRKAFGIEIKREEQKALWDITKEIATEINAKPINKIIITPDPGIGVYLEGNLFWTIFGGGRRVLEIGLPSLHDLNVDEFKVIIAHEYGHFSNRDTQWSSFTYTMGNSLLSTLRSTPGPKQDEKEKGGIVGGIMYLNPAYWILLLYVNLYFKVTKGFSRVREVMADIMAMKLYGGRVFSEGLHKVALNDLIFSEMVQAEYMTLSRNRKKMINNMSQLIEYAHERVDKLQVSWRLIAEIEKLKSGDFSQSESHDIYDSHPSLKVRIDYAKKFDSLEAKDKRPVNTLFNDWDNINEKLAELFNLRLSIYDRALIGVSLSVGKED